MQVVIEIPNVPIQDYQDLYYKIHGMAASEGLFDDKVKSQRALALKAVLDVLNGAVNGTPLPKGHGRLIDADRLVKKAYKEGLPFVECAQEFSMMLEINAPTVVPAEKDGE